MDLMPTILSLFGVPVPETVEGQDLTPLLAADGAGHASVAYGIFGGSVNVTDGRYTYFRYPHDMADQELYEYTLMPTHLEEAFSVDNLSKLDLSQPLEYAKGLRVLKIPARKDEKGKVEVPSMGQPRETGTVLYDLEADPGQSTPIEAPDVVRRLEHEMRRIMLRNQAPPEAFRRVGLV